MLSDDELTITDPTEAAWAADQRGLVIRYLEAQNLDNAEVSAEPRWMLCPYVALWAIRSKANPDRVGWWAISGDLPTDYITCGPERDNADVLLAFSRNWKEAAAYMAKGDQAPNCRIGLPGREKELAPLLLRRAQVLQELARDMKERRFGAPW